MIAERPETREEGIVYIDELAVIINREQGTIRKWERERLPKRLHPKRGYRNWRYWSDAQVWGSSGIITWMERNDMRPGNLVTDPDKADEHVRNLRRPKYLNGYHIRSAKTFVEQGKSRAWIVETIWPRTKYARPENLEAALVKVFAANNWYFPPHVRRKLPAKVEREMVRYEEQFEKIAAKSKNNSKATQTTRRKRRRR
jgi:hypothetical protein